VAAVNRDSVAALEKFGVNEDIGFTMLSDPTAEIIGAFDLRDPKFPPRSRWHGLARAMIVVLDAAGAVSHRFVGKDYRSRPDIDDVLGQLRKSSAR
jgi:peroxiredoxin